MMSHELVTSIAESVRLTIAIHDNYGCSSISSLSQVMGSAGFGTDYKYRHADTGQLDGEYLPVDLAANAASLGAHAIRAKTREELQSALEEARRQARTTAIVIEVDKEARVPGYESWWDVPIAEVSEVEAVKRAHAKNKKRVKDERYFLK